MNWNIFKRIAELEATVAKLSIKLMGHGVALEVLQRESAEDDKIYQATVSVLGAEIAKKSKLTEEERKERARASKRRYYDRNKEVLLLRSKEKYYANKRKEKAREYAKQYYEKKKTDMLNQNNLPA